VNLRITGKLTLLAGFMLAVSGCKPTQECGTWVFTGTPSGSAFPMTSTFTFDPAKCGKACNCDKVVMIQMIWIYDNDYQTNIYPWDQPQGTRNGPRGWSIDQVNGYAYGYSGLENDGTTFNTDVDTPGANGTPNTLYDEPDWESNEYFYAVDVAVCFDSAKCANRILGYYFWSYTLDNNSVGQEFITAPAWKDLDAEFQSVVKAWNTWAPKSGPQTDQTGITLPNAVPFPTLSDL
jgi:hypothetical protein